MQVRQCMKFSLERVGFSFGSSPAFAGQAAAFSSPQNVSSKKIRKELGRPKHFTVGPEGMGGLLYTRLLYTMPDSSNIQRCIPCTVQERLKVRRLDDAEAEEAVTIR